MEQIKADELTNDLRHIARRRMEQVEEIDILQKRINSETVNWDGLKRQQRIDQEMELAEIENKAEIDRLVNNFNKKLEIETKKAEFDHIGKTLDLVQIKELADMFSVSVADMNSLLNDRAKIIEAELLILEDDPLSELLLKKMLGLGLLSGNIKDQVSRKARVLGSDMEVIKQLKTARNTIINQVEKRTIEDLKQINLEQIVEIDLPR